MSHDDHDNHGNHNDHDDHHDRRDHCDHHDIMIMVIMVIIKIITTTMIIMIMAPAIPTLVILVWAPVWAPVLPGHPWLPPTGAQDRAVPHTILNNPLVAHLSPVPFCPLLLALCPLLICSLLPRSGPLFPETLGDGDLHSPASPACALWMKNNSRAKQGVRGSKEQTFKRCLQECPAALRSRPPVSLLTVPCAACWRPSSPIDPPPPPSRHDAHPLTSSPPRAGRRVDLWQ